MAQNFFWGLTAVKIDDEGVTLADGTRLAAGKIVVAAGTLASRLLPELPIRPRKGHLLITDRYPGFVRHQIVELGYLKSAGAATGDSVAFNLQPRRTGQLLLGSSRQYDDDSTEIRWPLLRRMIAPGLAVHARFDANESHSRLDGIPRLHARQTAAYRPLSRFAKHLARHRARRAGNHHRTGDGRNDRTAYSRT